MLFRENIKVIMDLLVLPSSEEVFEKRRSFLKNSQNLIKFLFRMEKKENVRNLLKQKCQDTQKQVRKILFHFFNLKLIFNPFRHPIKNISHEISGGDVPEVTWRSYPLNQWVFRSNVSFLCLFLPLNSILKFWIFLFSKPKGNELLQAIMRTCHTIKSQPPPPYDEEITGFLTIKRELFFQFHNGDKKWLISVFDRGTPPVISLPSFKHTDCCPCGYKGKRERNKRT